jgi:hypothetical protein
VRLCASASVSYAFARAAVRWSEIGNQKATEVFVRREMPRIVTVLEQTGTPALSWQNALELPNRLCFHRLTTMGRHALFVALACGLLLVPAAASAATVRVDDYQGVVFAAAPGEANVVDTTVAETGAWPEIEIRVVVRDGVAPIEPQTGCVALGPSEVICRPGRELGGAGLGEFGYGIVLELGDENDVVLKPRCEVPCSASATGGDGDDLMEGSGGGNAAFRGGPGDDVLIGGTRSVCPVGEDVCYSNGLAGGTGNDTIVGGPGRDALNGGPGADSLHGGGAVDHSWDYRNRGTAVRVTLDGVADDGARGEGDNLASDVEVVEGGNGADVLIGNRRRNAFRGGRGNDRLYGRGGDDCLQGDGGHDWIQAGDGSDRILAKDLSRDVILGSVGDDVAWVDPRVDRVRGVERLLRNVGRWCG